MYPFPKILLLFFLCFSGLALSAQTVVMNDYLPDAKPAESNPLPAFVAPRFPAGEPALLKQIHAKIRYPELAQEYGVEGTVVIRLQLDESGKIIHRECVKGLGFGCDEAALKAVKSLSRWLPAMRQGKPVDSYVYIPLRFSLL
jgi:protein TonB